MKDFVPAGEIIGNEHQVRSVTIAQSPGLPDGEYGFVDAYCTDVGCDCRKTMISVVHKNQTVAIINFGWESEGFYRKWMSNDKLHSIAGMHGASIDVLSPNLVDPDAILGLFNALLNDMWIDKFKTHYAKVKKAIAKV